MKLYNIVFSPTGGTRKVADALCAGFSLPVQMIDLCDRNLDFSSFHFEPGDICVISVPSFGGRVPVTAAQRMAAMRGSGAWAVLVAVYGNRAIDDTLIEMKDLVTAAGFRCGAAVSAVAEHSIARCYAAGRPDNSDTAELTEFGQAIAKKLNSESACSDAEVPGNRPYRNFGGVGMIPMPGDTCTGCGSCAALCPTGAISDQDPRQVDTVLCISCMRCVAVCPEHDRHAEAAKVAATEAKLAKLCADRKPNELFL